LTAAAKTQPIQHRVDFAERFLFVARIRCMTLENGSPSESSTETGVSAIKKISRLRPENHTKREKEKKS